MALFTKCKLRLKDDGLKLGSIRAALYFRKILFSAIIYNPKERPAFGIRPKGTKLGGPQERADPACKNKISTKNFSGYFLKQI